MAKDTWEDYRDPITGENSLPPIQPCPCCGNTAILCDDYYAQPVIDENGAYVDIEQDGNWFWIECTSCILCTGVANEPEQVIDSWNKRV